MPAVNKNKKSNNKLKDSGTRLHAQVTNIFLILYNIFFFILKKNSTCFTPFSLFFHTEAESRDFLAFFLFIEPFWASDYQAKNVIQNNSFSRRYLNFKIKIVLFVAAESVSALC